MRLSKLFQIVLLWRAAITLIAGVSIALFPFQPSFPYWNLYLKQNGPLLLTTWANFDGVHYLTIVYRGYKSAELIQVFFPLYPLILKLITLNGFVNPVLIGVLLSTGAFTLALWMLWKLIRIDFDGMVARRTLILLLLFPTTFFFTSVYTESFFLLFTVSSFYFARKQRWYIAGLMGALAAATRLVGIFLIPALLIEAWLQYRQKRFSIKKYLFAAEPALGLGAYMIYLWSVFKNPFLFISSQDQFGTSRTTHHLITPFQVGYRYIKMLLSVPIFTQTYFVLFQEVLFSLVGGLLGLIAFKKIRLSYALFAFLAFIVPTLTGTFASMPRYVLPLFPLFLTAATLISDQTLKVIGAAFVIMLVINIILFTQGLWVA